MHQFEQLGDLGGDLLLRPLPDSEPEAHVLRHGHMPERGVVLEDEADVPLLRGQPGRVVALDLDGAGVGEFQTGDDPQQSGLPTAAWAQQGRQLAGGDVQIDVTEGDEVAETLADSGNLDTHVFRASRSLGAFGSRLPPRARHRPASHFATDEGGSLGRPGGIGPLASRRSVLIGDPPWVADW